MTDTNKQQREDTTTPDVDPPAAPREEVGPPPEAPESPDAPDAKPPEAPTGEEAPAEADAPAAEATP